MVEEIARERLEAVPFTLPERREMFGALTPLQRLRRRVEDVLAGLGLTETYTPSLRPDDRDPNAWRLPEPISAELAVLRTSLLPSLVDAAGRNVELGAEDVALFEIARVFLPEASCPTSTCTSPRSSTAAGAGRKASSRRSTPRSTPSRASSGPSDDLLHPGKAATLGSGLVGELHPAVLDGVWGVFELDLAKLLEEARGDVRYADVASFPALHQDLAFAVPEEVSAAELAAAAREAAGPELREIRPFDVYRGEQVGEGRKSVAFAVSFQSAERTLTDEDAASLREKIVAALGERFDAELRA